MHFYLTQAISINLSDASKYAFLPPLPSVFISQRCCNELPRAGASGSRDVCSRVWRLSPRSRPGRTFWARRRCPREIGRRQGLLISSDVEKSSQTEAYTPPHLHGGQEGRQDTGDLSIPRRVGRTGQPFLGMELGLNRNLQLRRCPRRGPSSPRRRLLPGHLSSLFGQNETPGPFLWHGFHPTKEAESQPWSLTDPRSSGAGVHELGEDVTPTPPTGRAPASERDGPQPGPLACAG